MVVLPLDPALVGVDPLINHLLQPNDNNSSTAQQELPEVVVAVVLWLMVEMAFWYYCKYYIFPRLDRLQPPQPNPRSGRDLLHKILEVAVMVKDHYTPKNFLSRWFRGLPVHDIHQVWWCEEGSWGNRPNYVTLICCAAAGL